MTTARTHENSVGPARVGPSRGAHRPRTASLSPTDEVGAPDPNSNYPELQINTDPIISDFQSVTNDGQPFNVGDLDLGDGDFEFDPAKHNIDAVQEFVNENPELVGEVLAAEQARGDDARVTLVDWLTEYAAQAELDAYDPSADNIEEVQAFVTANPGQRDAVWASEADGKNRTTLVAWLEAFEAPSDENGGE
jgi:hypothetical protein